MTTTNPDTIEGIQAYHDTAAELGIPTAELEEDVARAMLPYMIPLLAQRAAVVLL